jgi:uncharacterized protein (TIGR03437 family)
MLMTSRVITAAFVSVGCCLAQSAPQTQSGGSWKHVAGTSISAGLAGEVSGPVTAIWYAPGTGALLAQTQSGRIFETQDFAHWRLNTLASRPRVPTPSNLSLPESSLPGSGAIVQAAGSRLYAAGSSNVFASDDSGRTWVNLTGFNNRSILGDGFTAVVSPPGNPSEVSVANSFGVWRSLDGGLSWTSVNADLPNLSVRKLLGRRTALLANGSVIAASNGMWSFEAVADPEIALRQRFTVTAQAIVTAAAVQGTTAYAGTADGRLLVSHDGGSKWGESSYASSSTLVSRIWVDAVRTDVALAAGGTHLYRTINGGLFWDDVTGSLQAGQIHGIAADQSSGTVYVATDRGVYSSHISLSDASKISPTWQAIARELPAAPSWDVRLNPDNTLTVALDGYGVFEAPSPNQTRNVRIVSGADLSERPAAPGSLISILGANVKAANDPASNRPTSWPVIAASDHSSQLQVPFDAASGTLSLSVEGATQRWSLPLIVKDASPAIFVDEEGSPLILDANSGLVVDPKIAVYAGLTVQILATGLGKVNPEWPTGVAAPVDSPPVVTGTVNAFLDGRQIEVVRATLAPSYIGYYLVELQIPSIVNRGAGELRLSMNGVESNPVKLYLEPNQPIQ